MLIKAGDFIKHIITKDIAYYNYVNPCELTDGSYRCGCIIYNLGFDNTYSLGAYESFIIKPKDFQNWKVLDNPDILKETFLKKLSKSYREGPWRPLQVAN